MLVQYVVEISHDRRPGLHDSSSVTLSSYIAKYTLIHTVILDGTGLTWPNRGWYKDKREVGVPANVLVGDDIVDHQLSRQLPGRWCHAVSERTALFATFILLSASGHFLFGVYSANISRQAFEPIPAIPPASRTILDCLRRR